jgi:hypothetical protein
MTYDTFFENPAINLGMLILKIFKYFNNLFFYFDLILIEN